MAADVTVKLNRAKLKVTQENFVRATIVMAGDIARQARSNAPVLTGNLQSSIRVEDGDKEILIKAGGQKTYSVPYARYQEYNHKTKSHYMRNAQKSVMSGGWVKKYYGGIV